MNQMVSLLQAQANMMQQNQQFRNETVEIERVATHRELGQLSLDQLIDRLPIGCHHIVHKWKKEGPELAQEVLRPPAHRGSQR